MRRAILLAHPAGHSLSPILHDAAFAACGIAARYEAWDVAPDDLGAAVARIRRDGMLLGANVTVPHKSAVMPHLDALSEEAVAIGAVNTVRRQGERLVGENTDAAGFLRSLREAGVDPARRVAVLLGAGGAARAVGWALLQAGVAELRIVNRTPASGEALARHLAHASGGAGVVRTLPRDDEAAHVGADMWVNATSVGMMRDGVHPDESPLPPGAFVRAAPGDAPESPSGRRAAVDLVYRPRRTRFLRDAEAAGLRTVDGLGMLLHQGAAAFRAWTGRDAPLEAMRAALEGALPPEPEAPA